MSYLIDERMSYGVPLLNIELLTDLSLKLYLMFKMYLR